MFLKLLSNNAKTNIILIYIFYQENKTYYLKIKLIKFFDYLVNF